MKIEAKALIRKRLQALRNQLTQAAIRERSSRIVDKVKAHPWYLEAKIVGLYYPIESEVNLLELLQDETKTFCFPKITDFSNTEMEFVRYTGRYLEGRFSLKEPDGEMLAKTAIDLILVPGLAFAQSGHRIGYGKGFFDHYLKGYHQKTIGIGYAFQLLETLPRDPWDTPLDLIITDEEKPCIQL